MKAAISLDPDFTLASYHRARALWWSHHWKEAMSALDPALQSRRRLSEVDRKKLDLFAELVRFTSDFEGLGGFRKPGYLRRARALAADHPLDADALDLWMEYSWHEKSEGSVKETVEACESLLSRYPNYGPAYTHFLDAARLLERKDLVVRVAQGVLSKATGYEDPFAYLALDDLENAHRLAKEQGASFENQEPSRPLHPWPPSPWTIQGSLYKSVRQATCRYLQGTGSLRSFCLVTLGRFVFLTKKIWEMPCVSIWGGIPISPLVPCSVPCTTLRDCHAPVRRIGPSKSSRRSTFPFLTLWYFACTTGLEER